jgi:hypothetical protein
MAYSAYVAATTDVSEVIWNHTGQAEAAGKRLELILRVLTEAVHHTPGIQRSISHLKQRLNQPRHTWSTVESGSTTPTTAHPSGSGDVRMANDLFADNGSGRVAAYNEYPGGIGFEELFAALLPEYTSDSASHQPLSTADLSMLQDEDWLADFRT